MLPVLPLQLTYKLEQPARLPAYPGSLWRSALGATLRRQVCITGAETCQGCPLIRRCAYGFLFDTPQPADAEGLAAQYSNLPHPYLISPVTMGGDHDKGSDIGVNLTLIGPGARFLPELLSATRQLRLGRARLQAEAIYPLPPLGSAPAGEGPTRAALLDRKPQIPALPPTPDAVRLDFEHPVRLRRKNRYLAPDDFDFATLFTTLMRRIRMLHAVAGVEAPDTDPRALADHARQTEWTAQNLRWFDWSRHSARQQQRIPMGGLLGSIHLRGDLTPLWPWLWIGQWLHVGKGAVMGLGRYRLQTA